MHVSTVLPSPASAGSDDPATVPDKGELVVDTRHEYLGYGWHKSHCRVRVYTRGEAITVVICEAPDNTGTSVTNAIDIIASEMLADLVRNDPTRRDCITWIEHYPSRPGLLAIDESFDIVEFGIFSPPSGKTTREPIGSLRVPRWRRITRAEVEQRIGMPWEERDA